MMELNCGIGLGKAYAMVEEMAHHKLMAIIKVWEQDGSDTPSSSHVVVFDQQEGDLLSQTQAVMTRLLAHRYGM